MKKFIIGTLLFANLAASVIAMEHSNIIFNSAFGMGTFSAGEHDDGSVFLGGLISAEWIPNKKTGFTHQSAFHIRYLTIPGQRHILDHGDNSITVIIQDFWHLRLF